MTTTSALNRAKSAILSVWAKWMRQWMAILPGPAFRRATMAGAAIAALGWAAFYGSTMFIGFGHPADAFVCFAVAALILVVSSGVLAFALVVLRWMLNWLPVYPTAFLLTTVAIAGYKWPSPYKSGAVMVLVAAAITATVSSLARVNFRSMPVQRQVITILLLTLSLATVGTTAWFLYWPGFEKDLADAPLSKQPKVAPLQLPNPAERGLYKIISLTYGPGNDKLRTEYGPSGVAIKSKTVDGTKIFQIPSDWRGTVYRWTWGFDSSQFPLNARVWCPDGPGPFPLVLVAHGSHRAQDFSDAGYTYLAELLASRGYIVASVDENFLNGDWTTTADWNESLARCWLLLEHLKLFREWNSMAGNRFEGQVDLDKIALIGHSRGGEAVANATALNQLSALPGDATVKFDYRFNIRGVIALAPTDSTFRPDGVEAPLRNVSYLTIQGGHDGDVSAFVGSRQFNRTTFGDHFSGFKSELWIYRANHSHFNSDWGNRDGLAPGSWFQNLKPLLPGKVQRQIASIYCSAFLEATLKGKDEYRPLFRDYRVGAEWLPDTTYVNRYADDTRRIVAGFDEDMDVETATLSKGRIQGSNLTLWKEQRAELRWWDRGDKAVYLGWREPSAVYELVLPPEFSSKLTLESIFTFDMADGNQTPADLRQPLDFSIELVSDEGLVTRVALAEIGPTYGPFHVDFQKQNVLGYGSELKGSEPVLQRYAVRLKDFPGLTSPDVRKIRFHFDQSREGAVLLDNIGFEH